MATQVFDPTDAELLNLIQRRFPLVPRPFVAIGAELGISPDEVMHRISRLKRESVIRHISAIFDSAALGYSSSLVAFKVQSDLLDSVAERVSSHAGVSHCYSRDAEYNLWFTITLGPGVDVGREMEALAGTPGVEGFLSLPTLKVFKIGVFLDVAGEGLNHESTKGRKHEKGENHGKALPEAIDRAAVRALQKDLPIIDAPFAQLARDAGMPESELISRAEGFFATGVMRRFGAVLRHVAVGFRVNAMICWRIEPDKIEQAGEALASHRSVSHCYQRATYPEWPYSLYTMIHCRTEDELEGAIAELAAASGLSDYQVLRTVKEYKKSRVTYFDP